MGERINKKNAAEYGRIAGIKSGEVRRQKKELRNIAKTIMSLNLKKGEVEAYESLEDAKGKNMTLAEAGFIEQAIKMLNGDKQAAEFCFKYAGLEPEQKINLEAEVTENLGYLDVIQDQLIDYRKATNLFQDNENNEKTKKDE